MSKTIVVFRKFKDHGDIIALFPEIPEDHLGYTCASYMHVGQHGDADPQHVVRSTSVARPSEYASLKRELESIGYKPLVVKQRVTAKMNRDRMMLARLGGEHGEHLVGGKYR